MGKKNEEIKILVVEDETILALQLTMNLQNFGYAISGVEATAHDAMRHADTHLPDMVLLDIHLKGEKSGTDVGRYIWQNHRIPIVYLTSYCDNATIKMAMESEPYGYLSKPFRPNDLKATLQAAWYKHRYFHPTQELKRTSNPNVELPLGYAFNRSNGVLTCNDESIKLTGNEIKLFQILSESVGNTVSFEHISAYIWREEVYDLSKLRNLIYRLRQKVDGSLLENVFEAGYRLNV
ncbi:response regulator [Sulfurospirillum barnesii]|uniref:Response regulator with CheY-like receiver domain and winged-helix DNA-binding domain n=1 Tax=Sulfurospirillum barnesii (strain ATCC 700032 / DSM 10660 / SES-3) TaxID=760154 RepID=I3XY75_SULBS|nr:response regulator [Sulfurospirillum barnesii]AFL68899.1 response regulator with CheY-like receiver domain and winged-helix DNA-binding domain [Sulfurospirillum barnesii SES-3]